MSASVGRPRTFTINDCIKLVVGFDCPVEEYAAKHNCACPAMVRALIQGTAALFGEGYEITKGFALPTNVREIRIFAAMNRDGIPSTLEQLRAFCESLRIGAGSVVKYMSGSECCGDAISAMGNESVLEAKQCKD